MWHKRWKWVEECPEWPVFVAWRDGLKWADRVEVVAGLEMLLDHGPRNNTRKLSDDLYAVYTCRSRTVFWIIVAVAQPQKRRLLPLAWGTNPSKNLTPDITTKCAEKLQKWRETPVTRRSKTA
jgi:hypothetical protein